MKRCVQCIRLKGFPPRVGPGTARSEKKNILVAGRGGGGCVAWVSDFFSFFQKRIQV